MTRRRPSSRVAALALVAGAAACGAAPSPAPAPPAATASAEATPMLRPARYLVADRSWIERTGEGLDRVVVNGRRLELRGLEIAALGPPDPEVDGGARAPSWAAGGAARDVFWKGKQLWGAETFMGALHPIAALPGEPRGSFDWLDGTGLLLSGGALLVPASGAAPSRAGVSALTRAVAADARRAVAVTALGHAFLTLDGGATYRDASADLGGAVTLEVRGDAIAAVLPDGSERLVSASGAVARGGTRPAPDRARPPLTEPDPFFDATSMRPIEAAARGGLPLADGGVVIAARGFVGRLDVATLRSTSVAPLDAGLRDAECTPLRAGGALLLACVGPERAAVVEIDGAPRTERTFDLAGASDLDRFVASGDDAIGYLGPCDGAPPHVPAAEILPAGEPYNASRQRTPVFCARAGRDEWIEHRLDATEAEDVIAWIPRAGGGAVALLAQPGPFLEERERVHLRGALRVVRIARSEPPLSISPYNYERPESVDRSLRVLADDTIEGWLPSYGNGMVTLAVTLDAGGHARAHGAPPHASHIVHAGRLALAAGDDGRLWETVDGGLRWTEVEPPPGSRAGNVARPSTCSPAGCQIGGFVRLGWTAPDRADDARERPAREPQRYRRPQPGPPLVRLACSPAGPPQGRRIADSGGFGYTPQPQPRAGTPTRIGSLGMATMPWTGGLQMPSSGDAEVTWVAPLDVTGVLRRVTLPIARLGLPPGGRRAYELRVGYLLARDGGLEAITVGPREQCFATLLDQAGITRPLGACAEYASVGVDLGSRVVVVHPAYDGIGISVAEAPPRSPRPSGGRPAHPAPGPAFTIPVALHEIHRTPVGPAVRGFAFGAGERAGAPVVVVLDVNGEASLAPIDPERGTLGAEERLRPLPEAVLGSAPGCAPRPGEARVVLPFEGAIGIDRASLRGVAPALGAGVAVLRWSRERACLDAVEIPVRDERFDENPGPYEPHGVLRKIVARFDGKGQATLLLVGPGMELRQRLSCTGLLAGTGEGP